MTYTQAIEFLYGLRMFGTKLGLENTRRLARLFNDPHRRLRFIHVAGTNGKGSTCAMLESIYRQSRLRVGLFTSPHLVSFTERLQVNRRPAEPDQVIGLAQRTREALSSVEEWKTAAGGPTFFEVITIMALLYFAEQECDLVIWETGMGGRLDASNIVTPLASVITNVELDHQQWLGETHEKIAAEKAGIIKPGVPVVTGALAGHGLEVITATAVGQGSPLIVVGRDHPAGLPTQCRYLEVEDVWTFAFPGETAGMPSSPLAGIHQRINAAVALATVGVLQPLLPVNAVAGRCGLSSVSWPGRAQLVSRPHGQQLLLDGAHNPAGAMALIDTLKTEFPNARPTVIFGMLADKDWSGMAGLLTPIASRLLLVPISSQRSLPPASLETACRRVHPSVSVELCQSLEEALKRSQSDPFVVITGSLYLIGETMELLRILPAPANDERGLNEWGGVPVSTLPRPGSNKP